MASSQWKTILQALIVLAHLIVDSFLEFVLGWYWGPRKQCTASQSPQQDRIITKSAVELASLIRDRKLTSEEVVQAYLDRLAVINPQLNAIVDGPFLEALDQAREIDHKLEKGEYSEEELASKPFLGVPFTTKDSTAVSGKLYTLGLVSRKNERSNEDAECVRLMKESGAIIIATTNVPEVNKWIETRNSLFGQTNNPYDLRRSAGGSSGGEASLIAACGTAFGLGTDIGGSIRIPAFNCGIFGHKATVQTINTRGCTFRTGKEPNTMVVPGPMSRYAKDLLPIFKVIAEPKLKATLKLDQPVELKELRYFYIPTNQMPQCNPVNDETQRVMYKVRQYINNVTGKNVQLTTLPGIEITHKLWRYWMTQEPADFNNLLGNGVKLNPYVELVKKLIGRSDFTMAAIYSLIDAVLPQKREQMMQEVTAKCKQALQELLGDDGVLFYHSSPRTAPFHYYPLVKFLDFSYFSIFNVLHVPATQVPMGLDKKGMPLGIQIVAAPNNDRLCLAVAEELERGFGGWTPPFAAKRH